MKDAELKDAEEGVRIGGRNLNNLKFTYDITLLASNEADMRSLLEKITHTSEKAGLYLNMKNTKMMSNTSMDSFTIGKHQIEVVQNCILLRSVISREAIAELKWGDVWHLDGQQWEDWIGYGKIASLKYKQSQGSSGHYSSPLQHTGANHGPGG